MPACLHSHHRPSHPVAPPFSLQPVPVELLSIDFTSERGIEDFAGECVLDSKRCQRWPAQRSPPPHPPTHPHTHTHTHPTPYSTPCPIPRQITVHVILTRTEARKHLDRARGILRNGLIRVVSDDRQHVQGQAIGSQGETYVVGATLHGEECADLSCSCPQGDKNGGMCKHSLALLLARVQPGYKPGGSDAAPRATACVPLQTPAPRPSALPPPQQVTVSAQTAGKRRLPPALLQQTQPAAPKKVKQERIVGRVKQEPAAKALAPRRKAAAPPAGAGAHKSSALQGIPYEALPKRQ